MKALSLTQPWATLVATGRKKIETRSWRTNYRGDLVIHASRGFPRDCRSLCEEYPFSEALTVAPNALPRGVCLAVVTLADCYRIERPPSDEFEAAFGDYAPGRYGWVFEELRPLREPVARRGSLGLWECELPEGVVA